MLSKVLKATYSGLLMFFGGLSTMLVGSATFSSITDGQWVLLVTWTLAAVGGTFGLAGWSGPTTGKPPSG